MQDLVLDTLFLPVVRGLAGEILKGRNITGFNLNSHEILEDFHAQNELSVQQYFKPYAQIMSNQGLRIIQDLPEDIEQQDFVFIRAAKNVTETGYFIAEALRILKKDAYLIIAAANDEGAARYQKILTKLGLKDVQSLSKNKARVIWARCSGEKSEKHSEMLRKGNWQEILNGDFRSKPGIFGWNKEDLGSKLLLSTISEDIKGKIADFGCGYGYLSVNLLKKLPKITKISCIDADYRAIQACEMNIQGLRKDVQYEFLWEDLTEGTSAQNLDYIVMNPPFHEGKNIVIDIGRAFIESAYNALKSRGVLWMVANNHLPYERALNECFDYTQNVFEGQGFKVFRAIK